MELELDRAQRAVESARFDLDVEVAKIRERWALRVPRAPEPVDDRETKKKALLDAVKRGEWPDELRGPSAPVK